MLNHFLIQFGYGFVVSLICGLAAYFLKVISRSGLIGGVIFGTIIYGCTGWQGFLIPLTFVIIASWATKHGYKKKAAMGIAQEEGGRRGAKHTLANILAGTIFALICLISEILLDHYFDLGLPNRMSQFDDIIIFWLRISSSSSVAMIGSFATAVADTVSSELGQLYGKTPINPVTFRRVEPGTEGAISLEGTVYGILASMVIACISILKPTAVIDSMNQAGTAPLWIVPVAIITGAFLGNLVESIIGASPKLKLDNEVMNFLNTLIGGAISGIFIFVVMVIIWP